MKCRLCKIGTFCSTKVFFRGAIPADVLFIGEAPGASEMALEEPFVGPSGAILDEAIKELQKTIQFSFCVTNTILCGPYTDEVCSSFREPTVAETTNCSPRLSKFITIVSPKTIIALGGVAAKTLKRLKVKHTAIIHPAAILRASNPELEMARFRLGLKNAIKT